MPLSVTLFLSMHASRKAFFNKRARSPLSRSIIPFTRVSMFYATPKTFMETLLETTRYLEDARHNEEMTKQDVVDSMVWRVSSLIGKLASTPTTTSFCIFAQGSDAP